MSFIKRYLIPRLIQYVIVTFLGLTAIFLFPRLLPVDPIKQELVRYQTFGVYVSPEQQEQIMKTLRQLYGLEGTLWEQYLSFWGRLFKFDFGPSLSRFPTPVNKVIGMALPWTVGLLSFTTIIAWILAVIIGGIVGYYRKKWMEVFDFIIMIIRPIPYYITSLIFLILFAYIFPIFPLSGGIGIGTTLAFNLSTILNILKHAILPALTLIVVGFCWQFQSMKLITQVAKNEDHVIYAKIAGISDSKIVSNHVIRNAMLPMVTQLGLQFGTIFSGTLITEMVFAYPGIGWILYDSIMRADYNLIMGIMCISVIAVTTSILFLDLIYPLFDPRVRYR
ncbi:MAG: ABC transporter permease [Dictyoglomus turgidum]|jgi:peptide/nickel transport system permease protein|uniref:Binding-protein-dependent transport systems inner membrane component n=1 Tax=Dictyoglomus turgidum (strain DSM 6724 / Z-1310) TaxID=515635 RepID=B8DYN9_DICTD|nr:MULTISPECIES: ABC transporter permease [Dictyoglomus]ACK41421.1 binding-protein-dependent transport systems inner membrane component [Dictyoglomus turgidum DSM 6724]PNV79566.1 MAG: ABC transporter permease [Dictyoglomus turgidum]HBU31574.1 ABC transporter permease [Dictyoglomus sp.]